MGALPPFLLDPGADQLAQMRLQHVAEIFQIVEAVIGRQEHPARLEIARPEALQRAPLAFGQRLLLRIAQRDLRFAVRAIDEKVRRALRAVGGERVLVFPFGAGDRRASVDAAIFAFARIDRQRRAEPRPEDQHHDVALARRLDDVLEMPRGEHRLVFPEIGGDVEEAGEFLLQALHHQGGAPPLGRDVAGRRDEDPQRLGHGRPRSTNTAARAPTQEPRAHRTIRAKPLRRQHGAARRRTPDAMPQAQPIRSAAIQLAPAKVAPEPRRASPNARPH